MHQQLTVLRRYDCNGSAAQNWALSKGDANLRLAGTNFCLDAGTAGTSGSALKICKSVYVARCTLEG